MAGPSDEEGSVAVKGGSSGFSALDAAVADGDADEDFGGLMVRMPTNVLTR